MTYKDILTLGLSGASFVLSAYTLWAVQFNRGRLKATQPMLLCLMRELPAGDPKFFLRMLLFTTGAKGRIVESMFLKVRNQKGNYLFGIWGHTEATKLTLGSGLFVGPTGVACDHHFNPRRGVDEFNFAHGTHHIELFAVLVGEKNPRKLIEISFELGGWELGQILEANGRLDLMWNAETRSYDQHVEERSRTNEPS